MSNRVIPVIRNSSVTVDGMAPAVLEDVLACLHYAAGEEVGIELGGGSGLLQRQDPFVDWFINGRGKWRSLCEHFPVSSIGVPDYSSEGPALSTPQTSAFPAGVVVPLAGELCPRRCVPRTGVDDAGWRWCRPCGGPRPGRGMGEALIQ
jgi:hypothetical protein